MLQRTFTLYRNSFSGLSKNIWLLAFVTFINRSGTMVVPFLSVYLTAKLGFTLPQAGWVLLCFGVGSILGNLIGGKLTDTIGYYQVQFWSLLLTGVQFMLILNATTFPQVCLAVFVLAIVADAFRPANHASIAVYSRPEHRMRSYALVRLAINLGVSIGPAVGGILAAAKGYNWLFILDGMTCIVAALLFRLFLQPKQEDLLQKNTETIVVNGNSSPYKDRSFLLFGLLTMVSAIIFMQLFLTLPVYYKRVFGMSEIQIGALLALNGLLVALLEMPIIYTTEGKNVRKLKMIGMGVLFMGLSYFMLEVAHLWIGVVVLSVIVITFGEIFLMPFSNVFALERSSVVTRGQYMAVYSSSWSVAHVLAPVLGMQVANAWGFNVLWYVLTALALVAFVGYKLLEKRLLSAAPPLQEEKVLAESVI